MATLNFILRSEKKGQPAKVFVRLRDGRKVDVFAPTEFRIFPELWSIKTQSFRKNFTYTESFTEQDKVNLEDDFRDLRSHILKNYNSKSLEGIASTKEWLAKTISDYFNKTPQDVSLADYISRFVKEIETGKRIYNHNGNVQRYKLSTVKNYKGFEEQFKLFQEDSHKTYHFDDINIDFYDNFVLFFNKKNYSVNTIGRHIKTLKVIMRQARDEGLHRNTEIDRKKFRTIKVPVQNIYLNEVELAKLRDLDLSENPNYKIARDVFLVGCYTAQRFSDFSRIRNDNIRELADGSKVIDLIQQKTGERVLIPIRPDLHRILQKYNYNVPKIFEQKLNDRIKKVGELAGINEPVMTETVKGGMKVSMQVPKHNLIKTHTARRSGCTNMYLAGISTIDIMKVSGHKTEREFLSYIKVSKEETAITLQNHPYFQQNNIKIS